MLSTIYKIFSAILLGRIAPYAHYIIGPYATPGKSATDQIFSLQQAMKKLLEYGHQLHHLFIDFKAAYDSIARVKMYTAMREFDFPTKLIKRTVEYADMDVADCVLERQLSGRLFGKI